MRSVTSHRLRPARPGRSCSWRPPRACRGERRPRARLAVLPRRAAPGPGRAGPPAAGRPGRAPTVDTGHGPQHVGVAQRAVAHGVHRLAGELVQRGRQVLGREQADGQAHAVDRRRRRHVDLVHGGEHLAPPGVDAGEDQAPQPRRGGAAPSGCPGWSPRRPRCRATGPVPWRRRRPTRRPVKSPGPMSTATTPRSPGTRSSWASRCSRAGVRVSTWRRRPVSVSSACTPAAVRTATPTVSVAVSIATMARGARSASPLSALTASARPPPPAAAATSSDRSAQRPRPTRVSDAPLGRPERIGRDQRHLERAVAQRRRGQVAPLDEGHRVLLDQLGQGQVGHLVQRAGAVDVGVDEHARPGCPRRSGTGAPARRSGWSPGPARPGRRRSPGRRPSCRRRGRRPAARRRRRRHSAASRPASSLVALGRLARPARPASVTAGPSPSGASPAPGRPASRPWPRRRPAARRPGGTSGRGWPVPARRPARAAPGCPWWSRAGAWWRSSPA